MDKTSGCIIFIGIHLYQLEERIMIRLMDILKEGINDRLLEFVDTSITKLEKYLNISRKQKIDEVIQRAGFENIISFLIEVDDYNVSRRIHIFSGEDKEAILNYAKQNPYDVTNFKKKYTSVYKKIRDYITREFEDEDDLQYCLLNFGFEYEDFPSWVYLKPGGIVNNQWLVHATSKKNVLAIKKQGFAKGVSDLRKLGLTTLFTDDSLEKIGVGYNFAFTLDDFVKYGYRGVGSTGKQIHIATYGDAVVVFRASGLRTFHTADNQMQTIFNGKTATDIVPVFKDKKSGNWYIASNNSTKPLYKNKNLVEITKWLDQNYTQYRKAISWEKPKPKPKHNIWRYQEK